MDKEFPTKGVLSTICIVAVMSSPFLQFSIVEWSNTMEVSLSTEILISVSGKSIICLQVAVASFQGRATVGIHNKILVMLPYCTLENNCGVTLVLISIIEKLNILQNVN